VKNTNIFFGIIFFISLGITAQKTASETSGDILQFALPAIALSSTYFYQSDDKPHWQFLKSYATAMIFTHSVKRIINKKRPNGSNYSFPSGHTASAFTGASFLQLRYGWKVGIPAYLLASYVGYTRIKANKHDKWDVLGGAVVGIGSSLLFVKPYKNKNFGVGLYKTEKYYVLNINYQF